MWPTSGPPGPCRPQVGPMLAPWRWLSGVLIYLRGNAIQHSLSWKQGFLLCFCHIYWNQTCIRTTPKRHSALYQKYIRIYHSLIHASEQFMLYFNMKVPSASYLLRHLEKLFRSFVTLKPDIRKLIRLMNCQTTIYQCPYHSVISRLRVFIDGLFSLCLRASADAVLNNMKFLQIRTWH